MGIEIEKTDVEKTLDSLTWLKRLMKEINNQDNRCTATPNIFVIRCQNQEENTGYRNNFFFTAKAAEKFLEENKHNYPDHYVYLDHAYRNDELLKLLECVGAVTGEPYVRK